MNYWHFAIFHRDQWADLQGKTPASLPAHGNVCCAFGYGNTPYNRWTNIITRQLHEDKIILLKNCPWSFMQLEDALCVLGKNQFFVCLLSCNSDVLVVYATALWLV